VVFIPHNCFGIGFIHTFQLIEYFIQKNYLLAIIVQKNIDVQFSSILCLSFMYTWKNIFHVIFTWHTNILKIFYQHHQNIPNISILVHTLMFTCSHFHSCVRFVELLPHQH
jgi:hypothetical protein